MQEQLIQLQIQVAELLAWKEGKDVQQISFPLDDASRNSLGVLTVEGTGSATLTQVIVTSGPTATVPAAYTGSIVLNVEGEFVTIPTI